MHNKGIVLKNKVIQMLQAMPGGRYHFTIAKIFCNSYILSSMLSSSAQLELERLVQVDEMWINQLMDCSSSVSKNLIYLELAILLSPYYTTTTY